MLTVDSTQDRSFGPCFDESLGYLCLRRPVLAGSQVALQILFTQEDEVETWAQEDEVETWAHQHINPDRDKIILLPAP
ncbi:MAG: hypothetical protein U0Q47_01035 [Mycobacterium sp.]